MTRQAPQSHSDLYRNFDPRQRDFRNFNLSQLLLGYAQGRSLMDVGCGSGLLLRLARDRGFQVEGIEPDAELVALARTQTPDLSIYQGTVESYPASDRFDTVVSIDILECVKDYAHNLDCSARLLNPGGRLIVAAPAHPWLFGSRDELLGYYRRFSLADICHPLEKCGLRIAVTRHWNLLLLPPYWLLYKLLRRRSHYAQLRSHRDASLAAVGAQRLLYEWFRHIENRIDFGLGLSLIVVADRP